MPFYDWKDKVSGVEIKVFRSSLSEYNLPPSEQDLKDAGVSLPEGTEPQWERVIGGIRIIRPFDFTFRGNE